MNLRSAFCCLPILFAASVAAAAPLGTVSGLPGATGLAVNAGTGDLYVKSGISGTVWQVPVAADGSLGAAEAVSTDLGTSVHIAFDLAGNLYGVQPGGRLYALYLFKLPPMSMLAEATNVSFDAFVPFDIQLGGAFAIESPGGTTDRLFLTVTPPDIYAFTLGNFNPVGSTLTEEVNSCGAIRSLAYRPRFADLVAALPQAVMSVSISGNPCTSVPGGTGFVSLQGVAWDNARQRIYVTDSGTGELIVIYPDGSTYVLADNLTSPTDVAYDSDHVFVAEPAAGRVSAFSGDPPPTPSFTPSFSPTPSLTPSATRTTTDTRTATSTASVTLTATATRTATPIPTATATGTVTATSTHTATPLDTATPTPTATVSPSFTATATSSASATVTAIATPTTTGTPIPTPTTVPCTGDCNGDRRVTIDELILAVGIALGEEPPSQCPAIDRDGNGTVTISEIITAVGKALGGC